MPAFNRFTERARKVILLAKDEAKRIKHGYIGTEHILLGLVKEGEGVAAAVLTNLGLDPENIRDQCRTNPHSAALLPPVSGAGVLVDGDVDFIPPR